jgi:transposase InsO family protein
MRQRAKRVPGSAERTVRDIRRATRRHFSAEEKIRIVLEGLRGEESIAELCRKEGIVQNLYYRWSKEFLEAGKKRLAGDTAREATSDEAVTFTDREKTFVSEASVYRLLKAEGLVTSPAFIVMTAADKFANPTTAINQIWQTDFTYLKVTGWGWFYLSTVLDDFSRYIVAWKLCTTMAASDVTETLELALEASGLDQAQADQRPRLLSDNGPSYIATDLSDWLEDQGMSHTRGKPYHPMTQGKIERWHLSLKSRILLENYYLPGDLERQIEDFVSHYNYRRYHESLNNLTPADVYFGRGQTILLEREKIKRKTIEQRRLQHARTAA